MGKVWGGGQGRRAEDKVVRVGHGMEIMHKSHLNQTPIQSIYLNDHTCFSLYHINLAFFCESCKQRRPDSNTDSAPN